MLNRLTGLVNSMTHQQIRHTSAGFSLLELIVALAITTMVLTVVYQIFIQGGQTVRLGQDYAQAVTIAESKLAEYDNLRQAQIFDGTEQEKFVWKLMQEPYQDETSSNFRLSRITVEVSWPAFVSQRSLSLTALKPVKTDVFP